MHINNGVIRVLHVIGSLNIGGSQAMIMNIYRRIDKSKIQFDFIIDHPSHLYFAKEIEEMGGRIYCLPPFNGLNTLVFLKEWNCFFKEHSEYRILHTHIRSYASLFLPIAKKYGLRTIVHSHSTSNGNGFGALAKKILQFPLRYQANYYLGCSREAGEWLFGKRIVNSEKYSMLKNAIDLSDYSISEQEKEAYYYDLGIPLDSTVFINVGRLHEAKNHMFLLDVYKQLCERLNNSVLLIVGDGELYENISGMIKQLGLEDKVKMLGARSDVSKLLCISNCFLFPSKWEGLPVTVVEAQAAGLPCYISDTVTKDVEISSLITYLPIDKGPDIWSEEIFKHKLAKINVIEDIKNAGFDVQESANHLCELYVRLLSLSRSN